MVPLSAAIRLADATLCKLLSTAGEGTVPFFVTMRLMGPVLDPLFVSMTSKYSRGNVCILQTFRFKSARDLS